MRAGQRGLDDDLVTSSRQHGGTGHEGVHRAPRPVAFVDLEPEPEGSQRVRYALQRQSRRPGQDAPLCLVAGSRDSRRSCAYRSSASRAGCWSPARRARRRCRGALPQCRVETGLAGAQATKAHPNASEAVSRMVRGDACSLKPMASVRKLSRTVRPHVAVVRAGECR